MSENKENINSPGWRDVQQAYADVIMEIRVIPNISKLLLLKQFETFKISVQRKTI